ncbi:MAG TPA: hypothetical protein VH186_30860 [Chloroflexia bacterium]|nr:hypothetical protein [Chloroflexia bacterium]
MENRGNAPSRGPRLAGFGCMAIAALLGFVLGLNAGGRVLPSALNWLFAVLFALFFAVLAFVFTGMTVRRDRGVTSETILAIPPLIPSSLKEAIIANKPPSQLEIARIADLDAIIAELEELTLLLQRDPRAGTSYAIKRRLEEIAAKWLDDDALSAWLNFVNSKVNPNSEL